METKLRHLLRQRNITITQAAKELGIKRETLQRKLSGQYPFYLNMEKSKALGYLAQLVRLFSFFSLCQGTACNAFRSLAVSAVFQNFRCRGSDRFAGLFGICHELHLLFVVCDDYITFYGKIQHID